MLRLKSKITIRQQANTAFPSRSKVFVIPFLHECSISSSWDALTSICDIQLPSRAYFKDSNGERVSWFGRNVYGESTTPPLLMRGDMIEVELGYIYEDFNNRINSDTEMYKEFEGYITEVSNSVPVTIKCQDGMYELGQIQCPIKNWDSKKYTVKQILDEILKGKGITVSGGKSELRLANFSTGTETVRGMLNSLKKYGLHTYFRIVDGIPTLRCSGLAYYTEDRKEHVLHRQKNVIDDDLKYFRTDDQKVGIKVIGKVAFEDGTRADGSPKIKTKRVEVIVPDGYNPKNGEIRTYHLNTLDKAELRRVGYEQLGLMFYEGFGGTVTIFGMPSVKHGDMILWQNKYVPEQNGSYLIKSVEKKFGQRGYRQRLQLHVRIDKLQDKELDYIQQ